MSRVLSMSMVREPSLTAGKPLRSLFAMRARITEWSQSNISATRSIVIMSGSTKVPLSDMISRTVSRTNCFRAIDMSILIRMAKGNGSSTLTIPPVAASCQLY